MPGDATPIVDDLPAVPSTSLPSAKKVSPAKKVAADVDDDDLAELAEWAS